MKALIKHSVIALAVLAIAHAQVFGLKRTFICSCADVLVETRTEHCHGPHTLDDDHHDHDAPHHHDDDDTDSDTHHHTPLTVELKAQGKNFAPISISVPVLVVLCELTHLAADLAWSPQVTTLLSKPPPDIGESPPAALQVAECMVLLV